MALFRRSSTPRADAPASRVLPIPPREGAGAGGLPTAYACVSLITHTATQARFAVERAGKPAEVPEWLRRPEVLNGGIRQRALVEAAATDIATHGLGAWWAEPVGSLSWTLRPLRPSKVRAVWTHPGSSDAGRTWTVDGKPVHLASFDTRAAGPGLVVMPFLLMDEQPQPVGPVQALRLVSGGFLDAETYAARLFRAGNGTGQRLETDADIPEDTARRWRDYWVEQHGDPESSGVPVLGAGLRLATDTLDPSAAAWIEVRRYNAQAVAQAFLVPARRLGLPSGDSLTYATARDDDTAFMRGTMSAYLDPVADALTALLPPGRNATEDVRVAFDWARLLAPTPAEQLTYYADALAAGLITQDEARAGLGLDAMPTTDAEALTDA